MPYLPTALWAETRVGAGVDVLLERPTEAKLRGSVIVVDSVFDTASDTFGIRVELPNPGQYHPGRPALPARSAEGDAGGLRRVWRPSS